MKPNFLFLAISLVVLPFAFDASAQSIVQIASDSGVSYFIKSDGSLWKGDFAHQIALDRAGESAAQEFFCNLFEYL